jgi:hypothetical protein
MPSACLEKQELGHYYFNWFSTNKKGQSTHDFPKLVARMCTLQMREVAEVDVQSPCHLRALMPLTLATTSKE